MTVNIAITGKSGSGKTTITKGLLNIIRQMYPEKSILLFDNDLSCELCHTFGLDIRNTIYGIRSGKHEYRTGIPQHMTKQEYVEWAIEDIIVQLDDNIDIIVSWLGGLKDCRCPVTEQISNALKKLIDRYDFVLFDCEYDLKYLMQLVEIDVALTLIVTSPTIESVNLAKRISDSSMKYAINGQMGVIINKTQNDKLEQVLDLAKELYLDVLGVVDFDSNLANGSVDRNSQIVENSLRELYCRLNLPQENYK